MQLENSAISCMAVQGQTVWEFSEEFNIFLNKSLTFMPLFLSICFFLFVFYLTIRLEFLFFSLPEG